MVYYQVQSHVDQMFCPGNASNTTEFRDLAATQCSLSIETGVDASSVVGAYAGYEPRLAWQHRRLLLKIKLWMYQETQDWGCKTIQSFAIMSALHLRSTSTQVDMSTMRLDRYLTNVRLSYSY